MLVDTEGFGLRVKVHSAKVMDYEGIKALLDRAKGLCSRASLTYGWRRATAGRTRAETGGKDTRVEVEILRGARKPAPEEALIAWAREWAKEKVWQ